MLPYQNFADLDAQTIADHLAGMVQCKTVSYRDPALVDWAEFDKLRAFLEQAYPYVHKNLERILINTYSLLYRWKGSDSQKKPILLMAHMDVVPVTPGTEADWKYPPFSGAIADGFLWGRGAIDDKNMLCAELEAVEYLLKKGFVPDRDVYLAFGHDEEVIGTQGAAKIAEYCQTQGITFDFVLDEGGSFDPGEPYGAEGKVFAKISIFEKGHMNLRLTARSHGGHSSCPPNATALGDLARAIVAVEEHKFPAALSEPFQWMLKGIAPHLKDEKLREMYCNPDQYADEIIAAHERDVVGNAMVRTTTAATQAQGSVAPNVLPQRAEAVFNFRLNPQETCESVMEHCRRVIANENITLTCELGKEASKVSPVDAPAYRLLEKTILDIYPEVVVIPAPMLGGTDSRNFEPVCDCIYRFSPFLAHMHLGHTTHATNERTPIEHIAMGTKFMLQLLLNACTTHGGSY